MTSHRKHRATTGRVVRVIGPVVDVEFPRGAVSRRCSTPCTSG